jgi:hypothetical protein
MKMEQILLVHSIYKWNRKDDPKRRHIKFIRQGITQREEYSIRNKARLLQYVIKEENVKNNFDRGHPVV